jgi:hypothetical protein
MKTIFPISVLILALTLSGCAWTKRHLPWHHQPQAATAKKVAAAKAAPATAKAPAIVTPDASLTAKVLSVNTVGRFVVLNFPNGRMPKLDQHLFLYRGGLKTAEVKVVGPQQDTSIVADMLSGDAQIGDTVRDQ